MSMSLPRCRSTTPVANTVTIDFYGDYILTDKVTKGATLSRPIPHVSGSNGVPPDRHWQRGCGSLDWGTYRRSPEGRALTVWTHYGRNAN